SRYTSESTSSTPAWAWPARKDSRWKLLSPLEASRRSSEKPPNITVGSEINAITVKTRTGSPIVPSSVSAPPRGSVIGADHVEDHRLLGQRRLWFLAGRHPLGGSAARRL